jgi:beta-lactamase regulating signal transducer with metallopeptidase domain
MIMIGQSGIPGFYGFVEFLIKSTLALSVALLISSFLHKKSASLRHFVLAAFFIGLLIVPLLSLLHLGWETDLLPSTLSYAGQESDYPRSGALRAWLPEFDDPIAAAAGRSAGIESVDSQASASANRPSSDAAPVVSSNRILDISLTLIWAAGLFFLVLRMGLGLAGASKMTREGKPVVDPAWRILMDRFLVAVGLRRSVRLKSHKKVIIPLTWGLIKPVILIPSDHEYWSEDRKSSALFHELSHIKRFDFLITILVRLSLALFWFNPLSWLVFRRMKCEQEKACDELVLKAGIKPSTYAANLLLFRDSAGLRWASSVALLGMLGRSSFSERLTAILKQKLTFKEVSMKTKISLGAAIILAVAFIAAARPSTAAPDLDSDFMIGEALVVPFSTSYGQELKAEGRETKPTANIEVAVQEKQEKQSEQEKQEKQAQHAEQEKQAQHAEQEKQEEYEKQKKQSEKKQKKLHKHTIVITNKKGKEIPLVITISEEDEKKSIKLDGSVMIKQGKEGEIFLWDSEGEELMLVDGKPIRLVIKEGDVEVFEDENVIEIGKGGIITWSQKGEEGEEDVDVYILSGKDAKTVKLGKAGTHGWVVKTEDIGEGEDVHIVTGKTIGIDQAHKIDKKAIHVHVQPLKVGNKITWVPKEDQGDEIKEALAAIRESLKKLKQETEAVQEIQKSLNELEDKLKKRRGAYVTGHIYGKDPKSFTIIKKEGEHETHKDVFITKPDTTSAVTVFSTGDGEANVVYSISSQGKSRDVYEKTVARVKQELPEDWSLEPEFDEDTGVIKLKITGVGGQAPSKEFIKKLTGIIEEEMKK